MMMKMELVVAMRVEAMKLVRMIFLMTYFQAGCLLMDPSLTKQLQKGRRTPVRRDLTQIPQRQGMSKMGKRRNCTPAALLE